MHAMILAAAITITPPDGPLESTDSDPHVTPQRQILASPAPASAGEFASIQVNRTAGMNVLGDAANEPSIAVDPTAPNRLVVGWRQFDTINSNFRQAGMAYSHDGGRTWSDIDILDPGNFRSDPVLGANTDGTFYYYSLNGNLTCQMFISEDAGETWSAPIEAFGGDKQWFTVDRTGGVGHANVYTAWSPFAGCCPPNSFTRSNDGAMTYIEPVEIDNSPRWGTMDIDADGRVYVVGRSFSSSTIVVARSSDAQLDVTPTFDVMVEVPMEGGVQFNGNLPNPGGITGQLWIATDTSGGPHHGNVYVVAPLGPVDGDPMEAMFSRSTDGGLTWTEGTPINQISDGWQWFASMDVAPNGRIDAVWNDTRNDPDPDMLPTLSETYYSFSNDAGDTWSEPVVLGPQWDSRLGWPNQQKIGDYYGIVSDRVGAHLIYATTYNGEQDVYYLRINDYDCNDNGVGDELDIADGDSGDCNRNGIPDECEIAAGTVTDTDGDGVPDQCACPADFNGDGALDILDFVAFQVAWQAGAGAADCDDSGAFDILDFVCFQSLFQAGCN